MFATVTKAKRFSVQTDLFKSKLSTNDIVYLRIDIIWTENDPIEIEIDRQQERAVESLEGFPFRLTG